MKQKLRFLSMLLVTMLASASAFAADWTVNLKKVSLADALKDTVYIRNVGYQRFLGYGEAWGSQVVLNPLSGDVSMFAIQQNEDGTYTLKDYNPNKGGWGTGAGNSINRNPNDANSGSGVKANYTDRSSGTQEKRVPWAIAPVDGQTNVFTIQVPNTEAYQLTAESTPADSLDGYIAGEFLGADTTHAYGNWVTNQKRTMTWGVFYDVVYANNPANCQWEFIPVSGAQLKVSLLSLVEEAEKLGLSTDEGAAALANADATEEEINTAIANLQKAIEGAATPTRPSDVTSIYISNPTPVQGASVPAGWTVTNLAGAAAQTGSASDGVCEFWNNQGYKLTYTIKNLPAGVYRFTAVAQTRNGMNAQFFVGTDTVSVIQTGLNDRASVANWFTQDADSDGVNNGYNIINKIITEPTDLTIGLQADSVTSDYWLVWREFKLESLGQSVEAFQYINQALLNQLEAIKANEDTIYTNSILDEAYEYASAGATATDKEAAAQSYEKANALVADLRNNLAAYATLQKNVAAADEEYWAQLTDQDALAEEIQAANDLIAERSASTAEVQAEIAKLATALDQARKNTYQENDDVTKLIVNPTFNDETVAPSAAQPIVTDGWTTTVGKIGGNSDKRLCEAWNSNLAFYQDITGLKPGAYQLSIQAFMRPSGQDDAEKTAYNSYVSGNDTQTYAYFYANSQKQLIRSIFSQTFDSSVGTDTYPVSNGSHWQQVADGVYMPNSMNTAYQVMNADAQTYYNTVTGIVGKDGKLRIGISDVDPATTQGRWLIFHDFNMIYRGMQIDYIKPALQAKIKEASNLSDTLASGEKTILANEITAAQSVVAGTDGSKMIDAYFALQSAIDTATTSINAYADLAATLDSLNTEYKSATNATEAAKSGAKALIDEVSAALSDGSIATADVPAKQAEMREAFRQLMLQPGSDAEPANYTAWIKNPKYAQNYTNWTIDKKSGSGNPSADNQAAEIWNATANVYQDITGLPEGTYQVKLKGFFRPYGVKRAWDELLGDSIEDFSRAKIYANKDSIAPNAWAARISGFSATGNNWSEVIDSTATDSTRYFLPNTRANARVVFDAEKYQLEFYTYVDASGTLRLGFTNKDCQQVDWLVVSDWELYYLGTESAHETTTGITGIADKSKVTLDEIYTIDGQRIGKLQRGINIVRGKTADGKVVTKKVIVK